MQCSNYKVGRISIDAMGSAIEECRERGWKCEEYNCMKDNVK